MNLIVNTDGASRGNPGPAAYGYLIKDSSGVILHQEGQVLGVTTNNVAEYTGVLRALEYIKDHFSSKAPHTVKVIADSKLIVEQLSGRFKIKHPTLKIIYETIKGLELKLGQVRYEHTLRAGNFLADRLANQALDKEL